MTRSDRDHLRILSICHYVLGGFLFLAGFIPFIHLAIGIAIVTGAIPMQQKGNAQPNGPPPELFGWLFIGIASLVIAISWGLGLALIQAGSCLRQRKWRTFCLVVAGIACLQQPLGLVLGVFTIIVLMRPSVRAAFEPVSESPESLPEAKPVEPDDHNRYHSD